MRFDSLGRYMSLVLILCLNVFVFLNVFWMCLVVGCGA